MRTDFAVVIEDVEWLLSPMGGSEHPEVVAQRVGKSVAALAKAMRVAGRTDLAAPFERARRMAGAS